MADRTDADDVPAAAKPTGEPILPRIKSPADLKSLDITQLEQVAADIRSEIYQAVSTHGGHLASNLGVVELTTALHYVYDFGKHPTGPDRLLFDVGHQCYPHKMLTGRVAGFERLRKRDGVGGFPMPDESDYDLFAVGHAGTAISTAVGMARGDEALGKKNHVVAMVGDASIVNGLAFEGLNNAGTLDRQLLIILNDNGMSISGPQGALAEYLERIRVSTTYDDFKKVSKKILDQMPGGIGDALQAAYHSVTEGVKGAIWAGGVFEALGIKYMGPIDGHDLPGLVNFLGEIKHVDRPVLLHVKTKKGHGVDVATTDPTKMHSPAAFTVNGCRVEIPKKGRTWTEAFADAVIELADEEPKIWALTAAMPDGTGLSRFAKAHPERFLDTGICESHLVAMAAGMAKSGLKPVAGIYSTFTQRAFDQLWQEVTLNDLPLVLGMDRAGYVGSDGAVHHGFCDQAFLRPMPNAVLVAPADEADLKKMLRLALQQTHVTALRYPRDNVPADYADEPLELGKSRVIRPVNNNAENADAYILSYGTLAADAIAAACELEADGVHVEVIDARFCKPLDAAMLKRVLATGKPVLTLEDHAVVNGFGTAVLEHAEAHGLPTHHITRLGHPDRLIGHMSRTQQLEEAGLDATGIKRALRKCLGSHAVARATKTLS
ncbi:MAG: 1-deoxy-D-xylulose-5-phosphate synthase [Planctomycetota bacterium]